MSGSFPMAISGPHSHDAESEHENTGEISKHRQRNRASDEDTFLPPCLEREMPVKRSDHDECKERTNSAAWVCHVHTEPLTRP